MSSQTDDQVLPESLEQMRIVAADGAAVPANNKDTALNPFKTNASNGAHEHQMRKQLFGPTCANCQNSEKCPAKDPTRYKTRPKRSSRTAPRKHIWVLKPWLFKHPHNLSTIRSTKSILLRAPIMRSVGRSLHHKVMPSESCYDSDESDLADESTSSVVASIEHNADALRLGKYVRKPKPTQLHDGQPNDLWSLVDDCSNMSLMGHEAAACQRLYRTKHNQLPPNDADPGDEATLSCDAAPTNVSSVNSASASASSSTCSQQARMPSNNCDVTMDELASYFETFVHIPKKMSSMAEMMYI